LSPYPFFCTEEILSAENGDGENSNHDGSDYGGKLEQPLREQDRFLPIANIAKIMKKAIPDTGKVSIVRYFLGVLISKMT
jgi:hypothetical protein